MSLALLFHYLMLNMFGMLVHPSSGACDLLWIYFMCCIALVRCVLVLRRGSAGVVLYPYADWSTASVCIEPEQYNPWNKSTISRKLLKMDVLTFETCWAVNSEIIKQVTSSWLSLFNYQDDARSNKHKIQWLLKIQRIYILPTMHLCVLCSCQYKQRLQPYLALNWLPFMS